uniref:Uncharacterized protein n=1 Tax=Anguilla anguilla TaxID=7936 RepID=A0A0E9X413_ANGAN
MQLYNLNVCMLCICICNIHTRSCTHAHDFISVLSVLIPHPFSCENGTLSSPFNVWAFLIYSENQETLFKKKKIKTIKILNESNNYQQEIHILKPFMLLL